MRLKKTRMRLKTKKMRLEKFIIYIHAQNRVFPDAAPGKSIFRVNPTRIGVYRVQTEKTRMRLLTKKMRLEKFVIYIHAQNRVFLDAAHGKSIFRVNPTRIGV